MVFIAIVLVLLGCWGLLNWVLSNFTDTSNVERALFMTGSVLSFVLGIALFIIKIYR